MSTMNTSTEKFWDTVTSLPLTANEAVVEQRIVLPLLEALGYDSTDIVPKQSVALFQGTKRGRPFEADFIVYSSVLHNRDTSLIVVEAKAPGVSLEKALEQGESYAMALRTEAGHLPLSSPPAEIGPRSGRC
jgi:predicted type IV restriction endonuclease